MCTPRKNEQAQWETAEWLEKWLPRLFLLKEELNSGVLLLCLICVINVVPSPFLLCSWHHSYSVCQRSCIWRIYCYLLWLRASKYEINSNYIAKVVFKSSMSFGSA
jgi:hypothetical protein